MPTIEENARREIDQMRAEHATPEGVSEEAIAAKMRAGLTRSQAVEVICRQADHDAAKAAALAKTPVKPNPPGDPGEGGESTPAPETNPPKGDKTAAGKGRGKAAAK